MQIAATLNAIVEMKASNEIGAEVPRLSESSGEPPNKKEEKGSGLLGEFSCFYFQIRPCDGLLDTHDWSTPFAPTVRSHPMKAFDLDVTQSHPFPITGSVTPPLTRFPTTLMVQSFCFSPSFVRPCRSLAILVGWIDGAATRL